MIIEDEPFQLFTLGYYRPRAEAALSEIQLKVHNMRRAGWPVCEIARRLNIKPERVSSHIQAIKLKGYA